MGALAAPAAAGAAEERLTSPNMSHVKSIPYEARNGTVLNYGTDIEFAKLDGQAWFAERRTEDLPAGYALRCMLRS